MVETGVQQEQAVRWSFRFFRLFRCCEAEGVLGASGIHTRKRLDRIIAEEKLLFLLGRQLLKGLPDILLCDMGGVLPDDKERIFFQD